MKEKQSTSKPSRPQSTPKRPAQEGLGVGQVKVSRYSPLSDLSSVADFDHLTRMLKGRLEGWFEGMGKDLASQLEDLLAKYLEPQDALHRALILATLYRPSGSDVSATQVWLHEAINQLRKTNETTAKAFEFRTLAGGSAEEVAAALDLTTKEVMRRTLEGRSFVEQWMMKHRESIEASASDTSTSSSKSESSDEPSLSQKYAKVIDRAVETIGDRPEALRWLGTPIRALDYATPISLLGDDKGREAVLSVLGRIEHGVL